MLQQYQFHHVTDLLRAIGQSANLAISVTRLARGKSDNVRRVGELTADLGDGARQLIFSIFARRSSCPRIAARSSSARRCS
ncbi:MAG: hypothetical protein WCB61_08830, partial [Pseudolabrys sp.]